MKRLPVILTALLLLALFLAGCNNVPAPPAAELADQIAVDAAATATLTAVNSGETVEPAPQPVPTDAPAPNATTAPADGEPASTPSAPQQGDAPNIILPPTVPDFQPVARPASSRGDPEAPVVIYEWSDYT
jgi:hypothetical protein